MYQVLIKDNFRVIVIKEKQSKLLLILLVVHNVNCPAKVEFRKSSHNPQSLNCLSELRSLLMSAILVKIMDDH